MGGMLLKPIWNLPEKRLSREDYDSVNQRMLKALKEFQPQRRFRAYRTYNLKSSFGDADFLCESISGDTVDWMSFFEKLSGFKPHKNGRTISVPIDGFQCDFNFVRSESYECAYIYMHTEVGNFCGVISSMLGLKYGDEGLYLNVPLSYFSSDLPDHEYRNILVTRDSKEIMNILGFDWQHVVKGFDHKEELYQWIAASRYFTPKIFSFEALNSTNRTRNRKRPTYAGFVDWCEGQKRQGELPSKEEVRSYLIRNYEHINVEMLKIRAEIALNQERRAKFNGNLIKELRGLEGPELGRFIVQFKTAKGDMNEWLDSVTAEQAREAILSFNFF